MHFHQKLVTLGRRRSIATVALCLAAGIGAIAAAQDTDDEDLPPYLPGLLASYESVGAAGDGSGGAGFQRIEDVLSHDFQRGSDPRLRKGDFRAQWNGRLLTPGDGEYRLALYVKGKSRIKFRGAVLLEGDSDEPRWLTSKPLDLSFGRHPLVIDYEGAGDGHIGLYWSGPGFSLEPVGAPFLMHDRDDTIDNQSERGAELVRALRCAACHQIPGQANPLPGPDLRKTATTVHAAWLRQWLSGHSQEAVRRMPNFHWEEDELDAVVAYLTPQPLATTSKKTDEKSVAAGRQLVHQLGCLACHRIGDVGSQDLYGGGDLSRIASKRPASFFEVWLKSPASLNADHRMPVFELSSKERRQVADYLASLGRSPEKGDKPTKSLDSLRTHGRQLIAQRGCAQCHRVEATRANDPPERSRLNSTSKWSDSCLAKPTSKRPGYQLAEPQAAAIETYIKQLVDKDEVVDRGAPSGQQLLRESNCIACHQRNGAIGLSSQFVQFAKTHPQWAAELPAMKPPSLNSVGDKLHDQALLQAISKDAPRRRPWLRVRMPRFALSDDDLKTIVSHFVQQDRIPPGNPTFPERDFAPQSTTLELEVAGRRLVTADGFGCTSCHAVGSVKPAKAPINATGADLLMLGKRIRRSWFDRWVRNPARIVPRMEMPSVQRPIHGVLDQQLDEQLAAVWHVLNQPDFVPPEPNPVRIVRRRNIAGQSVVRAAVITDVLHLSDRILVKPLLIGLANRQNLLLDLESGRVLAWWTGDTARQHTKGKTWMWKPGGENLLDLPTSAGADMLIRRDDQWVAPLKRGQFVTEFEWIDFDGASVTVHYRLDYPGETSLQVTETLEPLGKIGEGRGIRRTIALQGNHRDPLEVRLAGPAHRASQESPALDGRPAPSHQRWTCQTDDGDLIRYSTKNNTSHWRDGGLELSLKAGQTSTVAVAYESALPADQFATPAPQRDPPTPAKLSVAPGFEVTRLPLEMEMMPTAIAWQRDGGMLVSSLKGRVWQIVDRDQDGLEETAVVMADDVAAPFGLAIPKGLASDDNVVDVVTKYALLRLTDRDGDGVADRWQRLASGWGHTADYHDWAIGLPQDEQGRYFLSTACQQDSRSRAAANWRGVVLRLTPPKADAAAATYSMEQLSSGHRFPIGIARNRQGDLFVTDNQGNYNPFNELNHVVKGKHYGFINKLDRKPDHKPPLTPPAVNIPHPWTRSVNGICFLESPQGHAFGPYEGHLVGCEYDTRRLIRMTVEAVDGVLQGAAYPLTRTAESDEPLLGPLCAAVSPQGDLLVGCIRDSGWGGSNNVGTVVRLRPQPDQLGTGIAEVRVASDGLVIQWHGEVDWQQAEDPTKYVLSSFRRVSTPAYGGPDVDRRVEQVLSVSGDRQRNQVRLRLNPLRTGFVYEVRVQNVAKHGDLFPAEAYYTVNRVPSQ